MRKRIFIFVMSFVSLLAYSQVDIDDLVHNCVLSSGENTTFLKDFRVQLPKAASNSSLPVHKANIYLMKNISYRFTVCNASESEGELTVTLYDQGRELISSFNNKTGKRYNSVDFICKKTGLYTIWYSFAEGKKGSGVGVVCMIRE